MISSSGWTANSLIPPEIQRLIGSLGTNPGTHIDPSALQERRDMIAEGYRGGFLSRPLPLVQNPLPPRPAGPPPSTPASTALLSSIFGGQVPGQNQKPVSNWATGNFQVVVPKPFTPGPATGLPAPAIGSGSGWLSPTLDANGFYKIPNVTVNTPLVKPAPSRQAQPY